MFSVGPLSNVSFLWPHSLAIVSELLSNDRLWSLRPGLFRRPLDGLLRRGALSRRHRSRQRKETTSDTNSCKPLSTHPTFFHPPPHLSTNIAPPTPSPSTFPRPSHPSSPLPLRCLPPLPSPLNPPPHPHNAHTFPPTHAATTNSAAREATVATRGGGRRGAGWVVVMVWELGAMVGVIVGVALAVCFAVGVVAGAEVEVGAVA